MKNTGDLVPATKLRKIVFPKRFKNFDEAIQFESYLESKLKEFIKKEFGEYDAV